MVTEIIKLYYYPRLPVVDNKQTKIRTETSNEPQTSLSYSIGYLTTTITGIF